MGPSVSIEIIRPLALWRVKCAFQAPAPGARNKTWIGSIAPLAANLEKKLEFYTIVREPHGGI